jgi:uncharacterized membrane protein
MRREWHLQRNCSMSPRQVGLAYGLLGAFVLAIGLAFALAGAPLVLVFAMLENVAVAGALLHYARHATDFEHIALSGERLLIERTCAGRASAVVLEPCWTRIALPSRRCALIVLASRGVQVEVGAFVSEEVREQVALDLRRALRTCSQLA